ncbi:tudor domain-containing 6-like isoform X3 [Amblyomma americanum]
MSDDPSSLESWDPLREEYYSVCFNRYNHGPGANLPLECLPAFSGHTEVTRTRTICVKNLPVEITELGLKNLFGSCGKVVFAQRLRPKPEYPDKTIGFVDFRTTKEALKAITYFHDTPPFHLKVSFANMSLSDRWKIDGRVKDELDEIRRSIEQRHGLPSNNVPPPMGAGRGRSVLSYDRFSPEELKTICVDVACTGERRVYSSSSSGSSSGRSSRCSTSSDTSVETCIPADSGDRSVRVSIRPNASGEQVRTVTLQENAHDHLPEQQCVLCGAHSEFLCPVCKAFYCSPDCQLEDWPAHKEFCKPKGLLPTPQERSPEKHIGASSSRRSSQKSSPGKDKGRFSPKQQGIQKRNAHPDGMQGNIHGKPGHSEESGNQEKSSQLPSRPQTSPQSRSPAPKSAPAHPKSDLLLSGRRPELATLPLKEPVEVAFSFGTSLSEFYLQRLSLMPQLAELQEMLQASCAESSRIQSPVKGEIFAALFKDDGQWYRARVTAVGSVCMVYFIDYGNVAPVAPENIRPLPDRYLQLPAQAVRCQLHGVRPASAAIGWTMEAYTMLATMFQAGPVVANALKLVDDMHEVELASRKGGQTLNQQLVAEGLAASLKAAAGPVAASVMASAAEPGMMPHRRPMRAVLDLVKVGDILSMQVTVSAKGVVWCLALMPDMPATLLQVEKALRDEAMKLGGQSRAHEVTVGDYVASKSTEDGHWYRAYVTEMTGSKHTVRYVDYGNDEDNTTIFLLASKHKQVPAAAVRLLTSDPTSFRIGQLLSFKVESIYGGTVQGTVSSEEDGKSIGGLGLVTWDADLIRGGSAKTSSSSPSTPPAPRLQSNVDAKVLHVPQRKLPSDRPDMVLVWRTSDGLFVQQQSLTAELKDMMGALNAWVKSHSPEPSTTKYSKGDYVCALFSEDSIWYRGQVLSEQSPDGTYLVLFVDFGNRERVPASSLRPLPPSFAEKPLFAFCVVPQNVPTENSRLAALLQQELFTAVQVDTTRAGLPVVRLERKDGTCINDLISRAPHKDPAQSTATGSAPQEEPQKPPVAVQTLVNVPDCPVPKGPFDAVVASVEGNLVYIQPIIRAPGLLKVTGALANKAQRDPGYKFTEMPPVNQCVLALYSEDEQWYRARVVSADESGSMVRVQFLDYGNTETVSVKLLLPMKEELAREPASALAVRLEGTPVLSPRAGEILSREPRVVVQLVGSDSGDGPPLVRLMLKGKCINSTAACSKQVSPAPKKAYLERPLPTERTKAIITHVDGNGLVYLQQLSLASELQAVMSELNSSVPTAPLPAPSVGDAACARYPADNLWYRVCVLSTPEDGKCKVSFVDFGNEDFVPLPDIRALPDKMKDVQIFANCVALQGVKTVSKDSASELLNVEIEFKVVDSSQPCKAKLFSGDQCLNDLID